MRRKLPQASEQVAEQVAGDLGTLQQTVRNETAELRAWSPTCARWACRAPTWWT